MASAFLYLDKEFIYLTWLRDYNMNLRRSFGIDILELYIDNGIIKKMRGVVYMDITIDVDDYKLNVRAAGVMIHNGKVLVHKNVNSDYYALIGGRVEIGESSEDTIKREIKEELGKDIKITEYISTIENFFEIKGSKYHEIMFVYGIEFINEEDKKIDYVMKNIEGKDYLQYEWIELDRIEEYTLLPKVLKELLKENKFPIHRINDELQ